MQLAPYLTLQILDRIPPIVEALFLIDSTNVSNKRECVNIAVLRL